MFSRRVGVRGVLIGPGGKAAHLDHVPACPVVECPHHFQERLTVKSGGLLEVIVWRLIAPGRQVEEKRAPGNEIVVVGKRVHGGPRAPRTLNPESIDVIRANPRGTATTPDIALQGPLVS